MRKQTKIAALVSAAALLAIGASMTSFAYGWNFDGMDWEWLDRDGNRVTEEWKPSGGNYYWLDENGIMATDRLIEDDGEWYYVDENGVRVTNQWKSFDNVDDVDLVNGDEVDVIWYYFGDNGKAYKADSGVKVRTVSWNGKSARFIFDDEGVMQSGWVEITNDKGDKNYYYCGDETDGQVKTDWQYLEPSETYMSSYEYDDQEWFNFKSDGKLRRASVDGAVTTAYINGRYYSFDVNGVAQGDWFDTLATGDKAIATVLKAASDEYGFADIDGARTGWIYTKKLNNEDESAWYYLVKLNGYKTVPFNLNNASKAYAARVINGKTYMFDETGAMKTGIVKVVEYDKNTELADGWKWLATAGNATKAKDGTVSYFLGAKDMKSGIYYFSEAAASQGKDGRMMTGKQTVTEDGEKFYYNFMKDGRAYVGQAQDNVLYGWDGKRIQADDGNTLRLVDIEDIKGDDGYILINGKKYDKGTVIVTSTGKMKKSTKVTIDGVRYTLVNYFVTADEVVGSDSKGSTYENVYWTKAHELGK